MINHRNRLIQTHTWFHFSLIISLFLQLIWIISLAHLAVLCTQVRRTSYSSLSTSVIITVWFSQLVLTQLTRRSILLSFCSSPSSFFLSFVFFSFFFFLFGSSSSCVYHRLVAHSFRLLHSSTYPRVTFTSEHSDNIIVIFIIDDPSKHRISPMWAFFFFLADFSFFLFSFLWSKRKLALVLPVNTRSLHRYSSKIIEK